MKIGGVDPRTIPNEDVLVLPRGESSIIFRARGLPNLDRFHELVPIPKPPMKQTSAGLLPDMDNKDFKESFNIYEERRFAYIVVMSLEPSGIEWDTVDLNVPGTWPNWYVDLHNAGLTAFELNHVQNLVLQCNTLDDAKLQKAREVFLRGQTRGLAS